MYNLLWLSGTLQQRIRHFLDAKMRVDEYLDTPGCFADVFNTSGQTSISGPSPTGRFNPEKTTQALGVSALLPLEEVLWLFHHVVKAALWQLKIADFEVRRVLATVRTE